MKILVVGSGAREHALVWKLAQEAEVSATPGNPGIAAMVPTYEVKANDRTGLTALAERLGADLVVFGPEDPLVEGCADHLRASGFAVLGPGRDGAILEASKAVSKQWMAEAGVPTAPFRVFTEPAEAFDYAESRFGAGFELVVKASGNALGKGVVVCSSLDEVEQALADMLVDRCFGEAGATVVLEDRLRGREFSLLNLVSGEHFASFPVAQDFKRALDGDRGPNTGGMGSVSPTSWVTSELVATAEDTLVRPMLGLLRSKGIDYRGVLFTGVMVVDGEPMCLEYNVRFGDPETQSVVRRIGAGFANSLLAAARGENIPGWEVLDNACCTVVMASGGYPGKFTKGYPITIGELPAGVECFHAGTAMHDGQLVTAGGRVLSLSACAPTPNEARARAYEGVRVVRFEACHSRNDIA